MGSLFGFAEVWSFFFFIKSQEPQIDPILSMGWEAWLWFTQTWTGQTDLIHLAGGSVGLRPDNHQAQDRIHQARENQGSWWGFKLSLQQ